MLKISLMLPRVEALPGVVSGYTQERGTYYLMNPISKLIIRARYKWGNSVEWQMSSNQLRSYCSSVFHVNVGNWSYGSCFDGEFNGGGGFIDVGRYCSFAGGVRYFGANHPTDRAVMSPIMYNPLFIGSDEHDVERSGLTVGNDVWVGYGAVITSGCNVMGNGAVIGAGSIVTHDVAPYAIVSGVPARERRRRFDDETISLLERSRWWELEPEDLKSFLVESYCPEKFALSIIERFGCGN